MTFVVVIVDGVAPILLFVDAELEVAIDGVDRLLVITPVDDDDEEAHAAAAVVVKQSSLISSAILVSVRARNSRSSSLNTRLSIWFCSL